MKIVFIVLFFISAEACHSSSKPNPPEPKVDTGFGPASNKCRTTTGEVIERCWHNTVTCPRGCPDNQVAWDCVDPTRNGVSFVVVCDLETYTRGQCIGHIVDAGLSCRLCCKDQACGEDLPVCQNMPEPDICPPAGRGCPYGNVEKAMLYTGPSSNKRCYVHGDCDSVVSQDENVAHGGIQCETHRRMRRPAEFCCNIDAPNHDLPRCP